jgi:hypothetical protein
LPEERRLLVAGSGKYPALLDNAVNWLFYYYFSFSRGGSYIIRYTGINIGGYAVGAQAKRGCGASGREYAHACYTKAHIGYTAKRAHAVLLAINGIGH